MLFPSRSGIDHPRSFFPRIFQWVFALLLVSAVLTAAEVSRQPPAVYLDKVAPLLTPVGTITAPRERARDDSNSGITLLDERIHVLEPDGRRVRVWHLAYKAFTEAGAKSCAEDVFTYLRGDQKFHLVTAETIQPDGTVLPVRPNALLVQSPQRQADYALYDDQEEVKIIFPNVKEGSITRVIAVIEDTQVRMPGEYAHDFTWTSTWETVRMNYLIDLPAALAERLRVHTLGADIPALVRSEPETGRVRLQWEKAAIADVRHEPGRAPARQVGPAIFVSTIASWQDVGRWFGGLLRGRDQLSPALAAKVDAWTKGLKTREEIIRTLLARVANDVRYTGLELGQAAYQPHDCNEVWENQYGDCKDKANLLAAFLRHKGIDARVALVNTRHLGLVERRSPDYTAFTHAITAIADGRGGYEFCDPTIAFCEPGMIGPGSAERDVLVVNEAGGEWVRTPSQHVGHVAYAFDLAMDPTGELSGWMTVTSDGYYGAGVRERYRKRDVDETRRGLTDWVRGFFPGAEVVDAIKVNPEADSGPDVLKAYFIVSTRQSQVDGKRTLTFPHGGWMLPDLGTSAERESTYVLRRDKLSVTMTIKLPEGLNVQTSPGTYEFETTVGRAKARWEFSGAMGRAELSAEVTRAAVPAQEFGGYYRAVQAMAAWLDKPAVLAMEEAAKPKETTGTADIDLPLMPTGEGQIALVEKRYPYEGNHALRRAALERTLQYFPANRNAVFQAQVRLGFLDWSADKNEQALERVLPLLANYRAVVSIHDYAWAENLHALALRDLKRPKEALVIFKRLVADRTMTLFRRSNALLSAADILEKQGDATGAEDLLSDGLELDPEKRTATYQRLVRLLAAKGDTARMKAILSTLVRKYPGESAAVLTGLMRNAMEWSGPDAMDRQKSLRSVIEEIVVRPDEGLKALLDDSRRHQQANEAAAATQAELQRLVSGKPLLDWYRPSGDKALKQWKDFEAVIVAASKAEDPETGTQLGVQALLTLPVDDEFWERLERTAGQAEWFSRRKSKDKPVPVAEALLDMCDRAPKDNGAYLEGRFWRARLLAHSEDRAGEQAIYRRLLELDSMSPVFRIAALARLGRSLEQTAQYEEAAKVYLKLEESAGDSQLAVESLLRAVFIHLHLQKTKEALRVIGVLERVPVGSQTDAEGGRQIMELVALMRSGGAESFWAARKNWWAQWMAIKADQKMAKPLVDEVVPVIADMPELVRALGRARQAKDATGYFSDYRRVASAARWLPSLGAELGALTPGLMEMAPLKSKAVHAMAVAMLEVSSPAGVPGARERRVQLVAHLIDSRGSARALAIIGESRPKSDRADLIDQTMLRLWALAAIAERTEREVCAEAIKSCLAGQAVASRRIDMIDSLASLYRALGDGESERELLQREMANPLIAAAPDAKRRLASRLEQLGGSLQVGRQVESWIKKAGLGWYAFCDPQSLSDPGLRDPEEALKNVDGRFTPAQLLKLRLLLAQDESRPLQEQYRFWAEAVAEQIDWSRDRSDVKRLIDPLLSADDVAPELRAHVLWLGLSEAAVQGWASEFTGWSNHRLASQLPEIQKKALPLMGRISRLDRTNPAKLLALLQELSGREMGMKEVTSIQAIASALLRLGEIDQVTEVFGGSAGWQFGSDVQISREKLRFEMARMTETVERKQRLYRALADRALAVFPMTPRDMPPEFADLRSQRLENMPLLDREKTHQACLYLIKKRQIFHLPMDFWAMFLGTMPRSPDNEMFAVEFCRLALDQAVDDEQRGEVVMSLLPGACLDRPVIRERVEEMLKPWKDPVGARATFARIRLLEVRIALRSGKAIDLETAFAQVRDSKAVHWRTLLMLRYYVQTQDTAALRRLLSVTDTDLLLNPIFLGDALRAYVLLERTVEGDLAREAGKRELRRLLAFSWATMQPVAIDMAIRLAQEIDDPQLVPAEWFNAMSEKLDGRGRLSLRVVDACLRKNWESVRGISAEMIDQNPDEYHVYWFHGYASYRLGRTVDAAKSLKVYVEHSKDEPKWPEAVALLEKLAL